MKARIFFTIIILLGSSFLASTSLAQQKPISPKMLPPPPEGDPGISVEYSSGSTTVRSEQVRTGIAWHVQAYALYTGDYAGAGYSYQYNVDGGPISDRIYMGTGPDPLDAYFDTWLTVGTHTVNVYLWTNAFGYWQPLSSASASITITIGNRW